MFTRIAAHVTRLTQPSVFGARFTEYSYSSADIVLQIYLIFFKSLKFFFVLFIHSLFIRIIVYEANSV